LKHDQILRWHGVIWVVYLMHKVKFGWQYIISKRQLHWTQIFWMHTLIWAMYWRRRAFLIGEWIFFYDIMKQYCTDVKDDVAQLVWVVEIFGKQNFQSQFRNKLFQLLFELANTYLIRIWIFKTVYGFFISCFLYFIWTIIWNFILSHYLYD
jgi:hypothetical protein